MVVVTKGLSLEAIGSRLEAVMAECEFVSGECCECQSEEVWELTEAGHEALESLLRDIDQALIAGTQKVGEQA